MHWTIEKYLFRGSPPPDFWPQLFSMKICVYLLKLSLLFKAVDYIYVTIILAICNQNHGGGGDG